MGGRWVVQVQIYPAVSKYSPTVNESGYMFTDQIKTQAVGRCTDWHSPVQGVGELVHPYMDCSSGSACNGTVFLNYYNL